MDRPNIELLNVIDLQDYGENNIFPGDINGDGKIELIMPQGIDGPDRKASTGGYNHEKTIHCITAIDIDGNILWQHGSPMGADGRKYHGPGPCVVADLNNDGKSEIIYLTAAENNLTYIKLLNGTDGLLSAERVTGGNWNVITANIRPIRLWQN